MVGNKLPGPGSVGVAKSSRQQEKDTVPADRCESDSEIEAFMRPVGLANQAVSVCTAMPGSGGCGHTRCGLLQSGHRCRRDTDDCGRSGEQGHDFHARATARSQHRTGRGCPGPGRRWEPCCGALFQQGSPCDHHTGSLWSATHFRTRCLK